MARTYFVFDRHRSLLLHYCGKHTCNVLTSYFIHQSNPCNIPLSQWFQIFSVTGGDHWIQCEMMDKWRWWDGWIHDISTCGHFQKQACKSELWWGNWLVPIVLLFDHKQVIRKLLWEIGFGAWDGHSSICVYCPLGSWRTSCTTNVQDIEPKKR